MRLRLPALVLPALTICLLAVGCGGGGGNQTPLPPSGLSLDTDIAARGDTVVITGTNLGSSGTVSVGGVAAAGATWGSGTVTVSVPADAPGGPQPITVTTQGGSASVDLFVGVDYASGTLEGLAALGLPRGTAVRLGAGTFTSSSAEVALDNLSLYGRGKDATTLDTGSAPNVLLLYADTGQRLTITGLTLRTDATMVVPAPKVAPTAAAPGIDIHAPAARLVADLSALSADRLGGLSAQAAPADTSLELRDMNIRQNAGNGFFITVDLFGGLVMYPGDLTLDNVSFVGATSAFAMFAEQDVTLRNVQSDHNASLVASVAGSVTIADSTLNANATGTDTVYGARGVHVTGSTLTAADGSVTVASFLDGTSVPMSSDSVVTGNTMVARRSDVANLSGPGQIAFMFGPGTGLAADNKLTADYAVLITPYASLVTARDNTLTVGQVTAASATVTLKASESTHIGFKGNTVTFRMQGGLVVEGGPDVVVSDNTFKGAAGTGVAAVIEQVDEGEIGVSMTGNTFEDFDRAFVIEGNGTPFGGLTLTANDNVFDFPIDAGMKAGLVRDLNAAGTIQLDATHNVWGTNTDPAVVAGYISYSSITGSPAVLVVDPLTLP